MYTVVEIELSTYVQVQVLHGLANTVQVTNLPLFTVVKGDFTEFLELNIATGCPMHANLLC